MPVLSDLFGYFQVLEFLPGDNQLIFGSPEIRRRFFDIACSLESRPYYDTLRRYNRVLQQRNEQIRSDIREGTRNRFLWDVQLITYGTRLTLERKRLLSGLQKYLDSIVSRVSGRTFQFTLRYHSFLNKKKQAESFDHNEDCLKEEFRRSLEGSVKREDIFRSTVIGPHRDNYLFYDNEREMRRFSSQGEVRMAVIFLKLALVDYLSDLRNIFPILLFDDILLEIDRTNMERVLSGLSNNQLFFASTEVPQIPFFTGQKGIFFQPTGATLNEE